MLTTITKVRAYIIKRCSLHNHLFNKKQGGIILKNRGISKNSKRIKKIARISLFAGLYIVLTFLTYPVSYGNLGIEFRISEVLVLLCFFNSEYIIALTIGCFFSNLFGTVGIIDALFGTFATFISCYCIYKSKNIFVGSLFPVIFNGIIVGTMLYFIYSIPIIFAMIGVAIGEFLVVSVIGCPLMLLLKKNKEVVSLLELTEED